jgi:flagellar hook-associated protein 2
MSISSLSGSGSPFGMDGIVSGLRTSDIITKLMSIERMPLNNLSRQRQKISDKNAAYQDIRGKLASFQTSLQALFSAAATNTKTATVTPPTGATASLTAAATSDAIAGTYTVNVIQLATASTASTSKPISKGVSTTATLNLAGFTITPTTGTFTVNGVSISVNAATDTLTSIVNKIKDSTLGGSGVATGVNATIVNDANGNPNSIQLTPISGTQAVQLGSGADTSNFLAASHLVATNVLGGSVTSNAPLSQATPGNALSSQPFNLATGVTLATSGNLTINGTLINWASTDSLTTVLNRINSSAAGVKVTYDASADKVTLTNIATGNQTVSLSEAASPVGQSSLLAALGLLGPNATSVAGKSAQYTVATNGGAAGPTQYSSSNTITGAVTGLNLTLTGTGLSTVTVAQDTSAASRNVQSFVDAFNQLTDQINTSTKYDPKTKQGAVLAGDASILGVQTRIRSVLFGSATLPSTATYKTLNDIGISSGAYGSAVGSTDHLVLDSTKLSAALQNNPTAVFNVLSGLAGTATLTNGIGNPITPGTSWLQSVTGSPTGVASSGRYAVTYNPAAGASNNLTSIFTPQGASPQAAVTGSVIAGGTSSLIAGMTFGAKGTLAAGTEYVQYSVTTAGVLQGLNTYLTSALQTGGIFDSKQSGTTDQLKRIDAQIAKMSTRLDQRQQTLQAQFTRMETALGKLQSQSAALAQKLGP